MTALALVNNSRPGAWDEILAQTREMLEAAHAGDWDRLVTLERERHVRIAHFFSVAPAPHESDWVRRGIEEILSSDGRLLALCQTGRAEASAQVFDLRRKAAANRAYAGNAA